MSLGYVGICSLLEQNEEIAVYAYSGANWNIPGCHEYGDLDGRFWIDKRYLDEPELHPKNMRRPSGEKYVVFKKIIRFPDITEHIAQGHIYIERECKNAFRRSSGAGIDYIARRLLVKIITSYQENGVLPEKECFIQ